MGVGQAATLEVRRHVAQCRVPDGPAAGVDAVLGGGVVFHQVMLPTNVGANDNILNKGWEWLECWGNTPLMTFARNQEGEIMQKAFSGIMR